MPPTAEATRKTNEALARGEDPICLWCGKPYSQHKADPLAPAVARVPCALTAEYFCPK